jgi:hypothetical protein
MAVGANAWLKRESIPSQFFALSFVLLYVRPRLAHRRAVAAKNYHLAAPGSNTLAGSGANGVE